VSICWLIIVGCLSGKPAISVNEGQKEIVQGITNNHFALIITRNEKWIFYSNVVQKRIWPLPSESCQTVRKPGLHPKKVMLGTW